MPDDVVDRVAAPASRAGPGGSTVRAAWLAAAGVAILVLALSYRPRAFVVDNLVVPDGAEYDAGAQRLATLGHFDLSIGGATFASRYPPSFAVMLAPAYWVRPDDLVAGIWVCYGLWSAGCGAMAFAIARRFGVAAAFLVVAAMNAAPSIAANATLLLTDVPGLASLVTLLAIYPSRGRRRFVLAGITLAVGVACRSLSFGFAAPFLFAARREARPIRATIALMTPGIAVASCNAIYNRVRFGTFAMNGYVYWCAFPHSRFDFVFHPQFVSQNVRLLANDSWICHAAIVGVAGSVASIVWQRRLWHDWLWPAWLAVAAGTVVHLFYFFSADRFFLPLVVAVTLAALLPVVAVASRHRGGRLAMGAVASVIAAHLLRTAISEARGPFPTYDALATMQSRLPDRCRLLTLSDPVTIEAFVTRGTHREWVAATRAQEYADKVISGRPLDLNGISRRHPSFRLEQFVAQGARLAVPETADDDAVLQRLADPAGSPVFIDLMTSDLMPALRQRLAQWFTLRPVDGTTAIIECVPRATTRSVTR